MRRAREVNLQSSGSHNQLDKALNKGLFISLQSFAQGPCQDLIGLLGSKRGSIFDHILIAYN